MSWQSPSVHVNNDGNGGAGGAGGNPNGGNSGQPIGTEYTLQGVMRFLQTEWHRHERDRNSWEIERAEMKARIAKLEGENRAAKRLQQGSEARIKMLEMALKRERSAKQGAGGKQESSGDASVLRPDIPLQTKASLANSLRSSIPPHKIDEARTRSRMYLEKCLQEITYLLTPPSHPPPLQTNIPLDPSMHPQPNQAHPLPPLLPNQAYYEQMLAQSLSQLHKPKNQQVPQSDDHQQQSTLPHSHAYESRQRRPYAEQEERPHPHPHPPPQIGIPPIPEHMAERPSHQYNPFGQSPSPVEVMDKNPFSASAMESLPGGSKESSADGWDFDESPSEFSGKPGGAPDPGLPNAHEQPAEQQQHWSGNRNYHSAKGGGLRIGSRGRKNSVSNSRKAVGQDSSGGAYPFNPAAVAVQRAADAGNFKVKFALRGHLDVVRAVCFTGGGTAVEPEICTAGDDGVIKRWFLPGTYGMHTSGDVDVQSHFTHRGHTGIVTCLVACPPADGSASGDGWIFSGGQDSTIRVWERGRVEARSALVGHTDAVWSLCVLPTPVDSGGYDKVLLASGAADGTVKIWSVTTKHSSPGRSASASFSPSPGNSIRGSLSSSYIDKHGSSSGSGSGSSQHETPFSYILLSTITRQGLTASPTCICPFSITGENFIVSYDDAAIIIYDTDTGEQISSMASQETYDGTKATGVNAIVATTMSLPQFSPPAAGAAIEGGGSVAMTTAGVTEEELTPAGATGSKGGLVGLVISGHEDRYIRFYDANSGQCTYTMLAHTAAISSLALSPDGRELVSAGHDASLRFWSMENRTCIKEVPSHRLMRGEGVCTVVWSIDGRWVVSGGGDGVVKVFTR